MIAKIPHMELHFRKRKPNVYESIINRGESPLTAAILSGRIQDTSDAAYTAIIRPSLSNMAFWKLKDVDLASERIMEAKLNNEVVALVTDFDVDGINSAVVMKKAMVDYMGFKDENVVICVNNRVLLGYGFNDKALYAVFERCGDRLPTLIITADQGSNDSSTIRLYKEIMKGHGVDNAAVIVTDHHHIDKGEGCGDEAYAFVNPQQSDCDFDDPTICGCVVALLVMSSARALMIKNGVIASDTPKLTPLLTFACLATVADCVSLRSTYNRCIVRKGLQDMNAGSIPAWVAWKEFRKNKLEEITATELAFIFAPAINADSRTGGDGSDSVNFLMSKTNEEAIYYYERLKERNSTRKKIDLRMQESALLDASNQYYEKDKKSIVVYLKDGNHGIHGIVASRVKEKFSCPTIIFSPVDKNEDDHDDRIITGSGRCIDELNLISMVKDEVAKKVTLTGGGHPAAMGLKIKLKDLDLFKDEFERVVCQIADENNYDKGVFTPTVLIDHLFQSDELKNINLSTLEEINRLGPYGLKFPEPIFGINATIVGTKSFGKGENQDAHQNILIEDSLGNEFKATCFFYKKEPWVEKVEVGGRYTFAVSLNYDAFNQCVGLIIRSVGIGINAVSGKV